MIANEEARVDKLHRASQMVLKVDQDVVVVRGRREWGSHRMGRIRHCNVRAELHQPV